MMKTIGIIGGLGPYAGIDISKKILDNTNVVSDHDHINQILVSFPNNIPDRTKFLQDNQGENPAIPAFNLIKSTIEFGASVIGIACNQMHANIIWRKLEQNIQDYKDVVLVSMVDELVDHIRINNIEGEIAILGRNGIFYQAIYSSRLIELGYSVFNHTNEQQEELDLCIGSLEFGIKYYNNPVKKRVTSSINTLINSLIENKVKTIIIACTELPLAINYEDYKSINFIDAGDILAKALVRQASKIA